MKKSVSLVSIFLLFTLLLSGCAQNHTSSTASDDTRIFIDSVGRSVEIPNEINSVAPSGPLAQIVLYTIAPNKLEGLSSDFSEEAKKYIDEKYWSLPKFGQFYGKNASLNMEALVAASPDVIIDIGETKETEKEDMDNLQSQLGIPTIFISATLDTMEDAYTMLGDLLGDTDRAAKLSEYCKNTIKRADLIANSIQENEKVRVYMAMGDTGLHTNAAGSIHADVLDRVGAVNVADVDVVSTGGGSEVSFEQIMTWNPDVILVDGQKLYHTIMNDSIWKELKAVQNKKVYCIPNVPYSFLNNPPSINRVIGINWLGNLLYPDQYQLEIKDEIKTFYQLFYTVDLTDEQYDIIVNNKG
jgi:iron complex transport system substrate-binding protein